MKKLSKEQCYDLLKKEGWYQLWHDDNWIAPGYTRENCNLDWAGVDTKSAVSIVLKTKSEQEVREILGEIELTPLDK